MKRLYLQLTIYEKSMEHKYWRSLDEISAQMQVSEEYHFSNNSAEQNTNAINNAFDATAFDTVGRINRRRFVGILSASMAFAATSCRRPDTKIVPVVKASEYLVPGLPTYYTTVFPHGNAAVGLVAKTRDGRPIKLEGNEKHIASMGATSSWIQGSLLSLYDPDRMKNPFVNKGGFTPSTVKKSAPGFVPVKTVIRTIAEEVQRITARGKSFCILINEHPSPSLNALLQEIESALPNTEVVVAPALRAGNIAEANKQVLGIDAEFAVDYSKADVILSVDADFLGTDKNAVYNIRQFAKNRKPSYDNPVMSKLTVVEGMMSLTGMNADRRVKVSPDQFVAFLSTVANEMGVNVADSKGVILSEEQRTYAKSIAQELQSASGRAVVVVGEHLPVGAHALGIMINLAIGAFGVNKPINTTHQFPYSNSKKAAFAAFREELRSGKIGAVLFADTNPMYSADSELQELLQKVERRFAFSMYEDETVKTCYAYIPAAHYLESWGDAQAFDGSLSIQQPMIAPLNPNSAPIPDLLMQ
ncbi:MAG: hypothetical protein RML40_10520, partial [Bacteroidota bacterium]|nr:hypothetical protein [Bacteroidota bacterium]